MLSKYLNGLFNHENFPIHIVIGESLYEGNDETDFNWLGDISKIFRNGEAIAFQVKDKPIYFIDKYKFSSLTGELHTFEEFKAETLRLLEDDFIPKTLDELLLSITMYIRLKKGFDFEYVIFEYDGIDLDTHEDVLNHIKRLGYNVVDELVRLQDTRNNTSTSKSKFTVYF